MGQQQLLLLVLGIVIVGLAVVVGIQAFSENQKKANADAMVNDGIRIASDAQAWKLKPAAFGGGADATGFTGFTLKQAGYETDATGLIYNNLNGTYTVVPSATGLSITSASSPASLANQVVVWVVGTGPDCIQTTVQAAGDTAPTIPTIAGCSL